MASTMALVTLVAGAYTNAWHRQPTQPGVQRGSLSMTVLAGCRSSTNIALALLTVSM